MAINITQGYNIQKRDLEKYTVLLRQYFPTCLACDPPLKIMHIYWRSLVTCCICRSALTISTSSKMKYVFSCLFSDTTMTKLLFGRTFLHVFIEVLPLTLRILIAFMQTGKGQSLTVLKSYS